MYREPEKVLDLLLIYQKTKISNEPNKVEVDDVCSTDIYIYNIDIKFRLTSFTEG